MAKSAVFRRKDTQRAIDTAPDKPSEARPLARANEWGLTDKMESYALMVAKGSTLADAYRGAYDATSMAESSVHTEASKLMDNPRVAARVKGLIDQANERHQVDAARIRRHVMDGLLRESVDFSEKSNASARIKALIALGNVDVVGMFREQKGKDVEVIGDVDSLKAKLKVLLQEMTGIAPPLK